MRDTETDEVVVPVKRRPQWRMALVTAVVWVLLWGTCRWPTWCRGSCWGC